jgi:hypothetical protein
LLRAIDSHEILGEVEDHASILDGGFCATSIEGNLMIVVRDLTSRVKLIKPNRDLRSRDRSIDVRRTDHRRIIESTIRDCTTSSIESNIEERRSCVLEWDIRLSQRLGLIAETVFVRLSEDHREAIIGGDDTLSLHHKILVHYEKFPDLRSTLARNVHVEVARLDSDVEREKLVILRIEIRVRRLRATRKIGIPVDLRERTLSRNVLGDLRMDSIGRIVSSSYVSSSKGFCSIEYFSIIRESIQETLQLRA